MGIFVLYLAALVASAWVTFHVVEQPFFRMKSRLKSIEERSPGPGGLAAAPAPPPSPRHRLRRPRFRPACPGVEPERTAEPVSGAPLGFRQCLADAAGSARGSAGLRSTGNAAMSTPALKPNTTKTIGSTATIIRRWNTIPNTL
jgi:hypothetical protein